MWKTTRSTTKEIIKKVGNLVLIGCQVKAPVIATDSGISETSIFKILDSRFENDLEMKTSPREMELGKRIWFPTM